MSDINGDITDACSGNDITAYLIEHLSTATLLMKISLDTLSLIEFTHCVKKLYFVPVVVMTMIMVRKFLTILTDCLKLTEFCILGM